MGKEPAVWLNRGARWLLATVFLYAGLPKLTDPGLFAEVIGAYGLLPEFLLLPAAILLPLAELIAFVFLVGGKKEGLWLSAMLMTSFIGVLSYGIHLGMDIDCGCFGPENPEYTGFSGMRSALVRDLLLLIPLIYSFWHSFYYLSQQNGERR